MLLQLNGVTNTPTTDYDELPISQGWGGVSVIWGGKCHLGGISVICALSSRRVCGDVLAHFFVFSQEREVEVGSKVFFPI